MKFGSIKIEDKVFQYTLNIGWLKSVGKTIQNYCFECDWMVKKNEVGEKRS